MPHDRALVINRQWATAIASLLVSLIIGIITYAWSANAQFAVMQNDINDLKGAKMDVRLARMEEQLNWLVQTQRAQQKNQ